MEKTTDYRNRIKTLEYIDSRELTAHPGNWREHPASQAVALKGVLAEVGIAGALLAFVLLPPVFGAEAMPFGAAVTRIVSGQILYKAAVTVLSLPLIYTVEDKPIQKAAIDNGD